MDNYSYPIDPEWSREEMIAVIDFLNLVEQANEGGVDTQAFLVGYQKFKQVIRSIGEEKKIGREFESVSSYSVYRTVQAAKKESKKRLKLG
ncbi:UPF0223 family protein [Candidatus Enterococcus ferrettii]|uniref:Uncharacterized protein n=1 Tax=Candidatus Enterococcus ferrettii TaxID=2815324 RepID=A0ABV0EQ15_9ENTE|nr:UPF0223 family protein [Enterococcus sp. 665A]MBO1341334.1 UPF0223 family protein [Enterococcus sp. 665A]